MSNQATGNFAHQPREGFMAPTFRIFVRTWRESREFDHNVTAVWAEAV